VLSVDSQPSITRASSPSSGGVNWLICVSSVPVLTMVPPFSASFSNDRVTRAISKLIPISRPVVAYAGGSSSSATSTPSESTE
jgi:hypothetical protein